MRPNCRVESEKNELRKTSSAVEILKNEAEKKLEEESQRYEQLLAQVFHIVVCSVSFPLNVYFNECFKVGSDCRPNVVGDFYLSEVLDGKLEELLREVAGGNRSKSRIPTSH
uniref:Uncharacterized protein n=1 Tax=Parascaris equorum TaxID=6256 RepID=A0A914R5V2_PAREQ